MFIKTSVFRAQHTTLTLSCFFPPPWHNDTLVIHCGTTALYPPPPLFISESLPLTLVDVSGHVEDGENNRGIDSENGFFLQEAGRYNRTVTCCGGGLSKQMTYFIRFSFSLNPPVFLSSWWTVMCSNWVECSGIINWGNGCKPPAIIYIARRCVVKIKGSLWRPATAWCHYFK